jgi:hypothetical protein
MGWMHAIQHDPLTQKDGLILTAGKCYFSHVLGVRSKFSVLSRIFLTTIKLLARWRDAHSKPLRLHESIPHRRPHAPGIR